MSLPASSTAPREAHTSTSGDCRSIRLPEIDEPKIAGLCRVVRGLAFAAVDAAQIRPSRRLLLQGRAWSSRSWPAACWASTPATPSTPAATAWSGRPAIARRCSTRLLALIYETLRRQRVAPAPEAASKAAVFPEHLARFRRWGGPSGHVESDYALADTSTGSSGHGFSAGLGFAVLHRSCGLPTKAFVIAGDAETEEGMSYEARNLASNLGVGNLIVTLDYNGFGIDGPITEVLPVSLPEPLVRARAGT